MTTTKAQPADTYYAATRNQTRHWPALEGEVRADVCIIGGGFSGIASALELAERGRRVVLLEARQIGWGASGRNGGQLIRGLGHDLQRFTSSFGIDGVAELERMGEEAVTLVRQRIERHRIDCDLRWGFCELANSRAGFTALQRQAAELQERGYPHPLALVAANRMREVVASDNYHGALVDMGSGHLHPLNLLLGEAQAADELGVTICEQSPVQAIGRGPRLQVRTPRGCVEADQLIIACNAHLGDLVPELAGRVLPAGSYVIASEPLGERALTLIPQNLALCDQRVALDYFRLSADGRLLFGGACHYSGRDPADIAGYMRPKMLRVFPQLADVRIDYQWGGMIGIGANRLPQIGRLPEQPNIYYAQGYAGHGINVTHLAGRLLAEAICGEQSSGFDLFARVAHRRFPGGTALRSPLLALGMLWYRLKERLGRDRLA
ncbi:NAD(P)/FAD-dependent oxidoreductase [Pseudomonas mangrovi]|uniref:FAD-dependent oxidoreductase n=1 Tax=Pseudomonas mangrovi TaxID=2161748 RepID=A0A2T5P5P5_9PSED|nr:FAD-binding oxidoreductase [Pseudomonas mangrovi]PTU73061.1 FAD-dependent oxidoreductase [Pseudomonas mangrovi]